MKIISTHGDEYSDFRDFVGYYAEKIIENTGIYQNPGSGSHNRNVTIRTPGDGPRISVYAERIKINLFKTNLVRSEAELDEQQIALLDCRVVHSKQWDIVNLYPKSLDSFGSSEKEMAKRATYVLTIIQYALKVLIYPVDLPEETQQ
ncbi:hypothetical protein BTO09_06535 [Gilvibacter sp. SZ-19]|uniref:hypothetical protein n=1 Tax=Gilvibacter sp. SZ-19 TaxID=754429 RepID=UPI000B3C4714|nr:hypothetical protein [Gilvibacter sp. SZ-19]ARV12024.1 hypothetical protein BTO09_06535 [Gilvibacter sp. SZ-19]